VDLIDEQHGQPPRGPQLNLRLLDDRAHIAHAGVQRGHLHKPTIRSGRHDSGKRRLAAAGRPEQDQRHR
jgi:hypothetical protein